MDVLAAVEAVLRDAGGGPLHRTVLLDRALRAGHLDPFTDPDVRRTFARAVARGVSEGRLVRTAAGMYALPAGPSATG